MAGGGLMDQEQATRMALALASGGKTKDGEKQPWPLQKPYVQHVLEDTPPNAAAVLNPIEDTGESSGQDKGTEPEAEVESVAFQSSLESDLGRVMDMSNTDGDGNMEQDESPGVPIVREYEQLSRRQRQQEEKEEGSGDKGHNERSRSRPQAPSGSTQPQFKRTLKGGRSDPDDGKHVLQFLEKEDKKNDPPTRHGSALHKGQQPGHRKGVTAR